MAKKTRALKKIREHSMTTNPKSMPNEGYCISYPNGWMLSIQTSEMRDGHERHGLMCHKDCVEVWAWYRGNETEVIGEGLDRRVRPVDTDLLKEQVKGYVSVEQLTKLMYLLASGEATDARRLLQ